MTVVKKTTQYKIIKRRDNRFAVKNADGRPVNGEDKVAILQEEGLLAKPEPKPEPVAEVEEAPAEGAEEAAAADEGDKEAE
jgi:hypothetical protein